MAKKYFWNKFNGGVLHHGSGKNKKVINKGDPIPWDELEPDQQEAHLASGNVLVVDDSVTPAEPEIRNKAAKVIELSPPAGVEMIDRSGASPKKAKKKKGKGK